MLFTCPRQRVLGDIVVDGHRGLSFFIALTEYLLPVTGKVRALKANTLTS
jgi:hypothetical protein